MKMLPRLRLAAALCALALPILQGAETAAAPTAIAPANPAALAIEVGPLLQTPTATEITVMWITNRNTTATVEYGPVGGELKSAFSSHDGLIDANERVHKVTLRDLQPSATYRYRVVSREIVNLRNWRNVFGETVTSEFSQFRVTDKAQPAFSFLVLNDIHGAPATLPELLKVAGPQPYELVVLNGDILTSIETEDQIVAMLRQTATDFSTKIPLLWVRGNHETRGQIARQLPAYLGLPNNRYYFTCDQGPIHFIVLDAGEDKVDDHREYNGLADFYRYRREQGEWLKAAVQTEAFRRAKYRVVLVHMPFPLGYSEEAMRKAEKGGFLGMADAFANFGPTLDAAGVDLMISGHTHRAAIIQAEAGRHQYPILIGGGNKGEGRTIMRVEADASALSATILRPDGTVFGTCRVPAKR